MAKDPAVLLYRDKWNSESSGLKAEYRAWYMDLLLYQHDKGSIPNDEDTIAGICHVLPSEYQKFKDFLTQIITQKFRKCEEENTYKNDVMEEILRKRADFKDKKSRSGYIGNIIKSIKKLPGTTEEDIKKSIGVLMNLSTEEIKNIHNYADNTHLRTHLRTLYINVDVIVNKDINNSEKGVIGEKTLKSEKFDFGKELVNLGADKNLVEEWLQVRKKKRATNTLTALRVFLAQVERSGLSLDKTLTLCVSRSWSGFEASWAKSENGVEKSKVDKNMDAAIGALEIIRSNKNENEVPRLA